MPRLTSLVLALVLALPVAAQDAAPDYPETPAPEARPAEPMTLERMMQIVTVLDPEAQVEGRVAQFTIDEVGVLLVSDPAADRMRILVPVGPAEGLEPAAMLRMLQANFDTALDARYAVARGVLWATYIHPLSPLDKAQLIGGIGQTVNLARTYGTLFSSGGLAFGGGDSTDLQRKLIEDLLEKGEEI